MSITTYKYSWDHLLDIVNGDAPLFIYKMYDKHIQQWVNVGMMIKLNTHFYRIEMLDDNMLTLSPTFPGSAERLTPISKKKFHLMNKLGILKPLMTGE